jgi:hypothetical protein
MRAECIRCKSKKSCTNIVQLDAGSYFTKVDTKRCVRVALDAIQDKKRHWSGVAWHSQDPKRTARLHKKGLKRPHGWTILAFDDLEKGLRYVEQDVFSRMGATIVERIGGIPMGAPTSPPLARLDSEHAVRSWSRNTTLHKQLNVYISRVPVQKILTGIQYVDDILVFSKALCCTCMQDVVRNIFPQDIDIKTEAKIEATGRLDFLHARIDVVQNNETSTDFKIRPILHNIDFAKGEMPHPKIAKIALFIDDGTQHYDTIQRILWPRLQLAYDTFEASLQDVDNVVQTWCAHMAEAMHMRWPIQFVAKSFRSWRKFDKSRWCCLCRFFGKRVQHNKPLAQHLDSFTTPNVQFNNKTFAILECIGQDVVLSDAKLS